MAHYAFLDDSNIVTEVIVGEDENILIEEMTPQEWYANYRGQTCIRTSYNGNIHKNYAGIGYHFDGIGFYAPQPYPSWTFNATFYLWEAPNPMPTDNKIYMWDETTVSWVEVQ